MAIITLDGIEPAGPSAAAAPAQPPPQPTAADNNAANMSAVDSGHKYSEDKGNRLVIKIKLIQC